MGVHSNEKMKEIRHLADKARKFSEASLKCKNFFPNCDQEALQLA